MATPVTVQSFRSSFRDWVGEETTFARKVAEATLAHGVGGYDRARLTPCDALGWRRALMDAWVAFCGGGDRAAGEPKYAAAARSGEESYGDGPTPV